MSDDTPHSDATRIETISSGIAELDELLKGGYVRGRTYLVQGVSGTGKSLLGQHFLQDGLENGETVVYIHGEESRGDILTNAGQLSVDIADAEFLDIGPGTDFFAEDISYDLVETTEVESERFTKDIKEIIESVNPERVLIDPITQLQYVERDEYQYRKRLQSLIRFLRDRQVTTVTTRTLSQGASTEFTFDDFESLSDGVIKLYLDDSERRIAVPKHRGLGQIDGTHGLEIRDDGIEIYPQVVPKHTNRTFDPSLLSTGDDAFDALLGGGIERSAVSFISGPTGIGKSTIGAEILTGIAAGGGSVLAYLFEESIEQFTYRCENLGLPITELRESGALQLTEVEPLVQSAEEFGQHVVTEAEKHQPDVVLIDGLAGYKISLQGEEQRLVRRLHGLTRVLKNRGVAIVLTDEADQLTGVPTATSTNTSYIADTIVYLTYVELDAELNRAIGVLKKRLGGFDNRFHRFTIEDGEGLRIAGTFDGVHGIMRGTPVQGEHQ
ncbi:recombinase RecA [Halonotius terrestris]|uniref:non-specific serine/threonine protein kinase n=1 Tax=Halonotius terrestris TaxID=2487750 RepID=A0A8J8TCW8_9EURY|nr:ATPase domain-containing protein [Halonotius terrestris]TQQ82833.1 recombinase RecA [Halonotius terrestris]